MTVGEACEAYLRDLEARNIRKSTREGYASIFRHLAAFAGEAGLESLPDIDRDAIRPWRERWPWSFSTRRRRDSQLKAFFSHARREGWIAESPFNGIRSPQPDARPTLPLSVDEMRELLSASRDKPKERAFLLLMRYSGLSIMDAATLERSALQSTGELILRRAKSEELVTVLLPAEAAAALDAIPQPHGRHFFWTGGSTRETVSKYWRNRLKRVASDAGIEGFHPHRLRDTFAVELLLSGVCMDDVSTLLGHSSVRTTEQYYAPWNQARRSRLVEVVRKVHRQDPILLDFTQKKPAGSVDAPPAEASLATNDVPKPTRSAHAHGST